MAGRLFGNPRCLAAAIVSATVFTTASLPARGEVDVLIRYGVLGRLMAQQMFTQDGRRYIKGTSRARCNFAYLEAPRVDAVAGRLRIRARFSGRSALDMLGRCVGFGDDFEVEITGRPYFGRGAVRLDAVVVRTAANGFYARRVAAALARSVPDQFEYPLQADMKRAIEAGGSTAGQVRDLRRFEVPKIEVREDGLVISMAFEIEVR